MSGNGKAHRKPNPYVGWYAAGIFLAVTFVAAAVVWVMFHPV